MSIENPSKASPSFEEIRKTQRETSEEAQEHRDAELRHIDLFMQEEISHIREIDQASVREYMEAHAGTWREFDNEDIRLAANPAIENNNLVLIFSLFGASETEERIPLH